jgi:hypothetical protein
MNGTHRSPSGIQRRLQSLLKGPNQLLSAQEKTPVAGAAQHETTTTNYSNFTTEEVY